MVCVLEFTGRLPKGIVRGRVLTDITHQHFTHNEHIALISTAVFSISVVVSVFIVSQCQCLLLVF